MATGFVDYPVRYQLAIVAAAIAGQHAKPGQKPKVDQFLVPPPVKDEDEEFDAIYNMRAR